MTIRNRIIKFNLTLRKIKREEDCKNFEIAILRQELKLLRFYIKNYDFDREKLLKILDMIHRANGARERRSISIFWFNRILDML